MPRPTLLHAVALAALVVLSGVVHAVDWPQWRGPERDGVWRDDGVMESFPAGGLNVTWRARVGLGWSSPVVAQGRVYVTDAELARPVATERVLCFDEANGKPLWTHQYPAGYPDWAFGAGAGGPRSTPIVRDGRVYTLGCMGHLFCLDAASGAVVWEKRLADEYAQKEFTGITASPLIEGGLLILYLCGAPKACVVAFDKDTGKEAWRALDDAFTYSSPVVITAGGQRQFIIWTQAAVTSLNPATGQVWWREELRTPGDMAVSTPVAAGGRLLVGGLMFRLAEDRPAATVVWPESKAVKARVLSNTSTALLLGDLVFSARTTGELVCLDAASGGEVWQTDAVTPLENGSSIHLTPNGDSVLLFTDQGLLIRARLSGAGYEELSRAKLLEPTYAFNGRNRVWPVPAYANRHVFARNDTELVCADLTATPRQ